jgi:hypothetical protein
MLEVFEWGLEWLTRFPWRRLATLGEDPVVGKQATPARFHRSISKEGP